MATRKSIKAVLDNFLGTFTSRYSDYGGYWLFGFLATEAKPLKFDLLTDATLSTTTPVATAADLAVRKFHEQLAKHGLDRSRVRAASVSIEWFPITVEEQMTRRQIAGYEARVSASAVTDLGRRYQSERSFFVAPHNPRTEMRSARAVNN